MIVKSSFFVAAALLLIVIPANMRAQDTALGFTRIDRNPRTSALAGAGMASVRSSAYSAFGNAAQLGFLPGRGDVGVGVQLWEMSNEVDKTTNFNAAAGFRFGHFALALGGAYQMGVPQGFFTPADGLVSLGLAYNILDVVSVGVNTRYALQNLTQEYQINGFSLDLSVLGRISPAVSVAVGVGTNGNVIASSTGTSKQPAYLRGGAAWNLNPAPKHAVELMLDAEYNFDGTFAADLGAEYDYNQTLYARVGYRYASRLALIPSHLALGVGVRFAGFRAEVSYLTASPVLGNTLNLGMGYSF